MLVLIRAFEDSIVVDGFKDLKTSVSKGALGKVQVQQSEIQSTKQRVLQGSAVSQ